MQSATLMVNRRLAGIASLTCAIASTLLACGSDSGSMFGDGTGKSGIDNSGADPEGTFQDPLGPNGSLYSCATSTADTRLTPANLVVMYDKSGSMGNTTEGFNADQRWIPINKGMTDFFADPRSSTMSASLQFFPLSNSSSSDERTQIDATCNYDYSKPRLSLTPLTNHQYFELTLGGVSPGGGTPTLPALRGAIRYAKGVAAGHPDDKTVVVLVTDGEPGFVLPPDNTRIPGCDGNTIDNVASEARTAFESKPSVPTYVIGIGDIGNMNQVAVAGGTNKAFIIDPKNPDSTKSVFQSALEDIRAKNLTCDFAMPVPKEGQKIDPKAFNIVFTKSNNQYLVLDYNQECADGSGWKYNDPTNPSVVTLCENTCKKVQSDNGGKLRLAFGCATEKTPLK